jgi:hypothetical protein
MGAGLAAAPTTVMDARGAARPPQHSGSVRAGAVPPADLDLVVEPSTVIDDRSIARRAPSMPARELAKVTCP